MRNFLFLFFIYSISVNAQELNYIDYHLNINKAELQIKKHNYDSAIIIYEKIFLKYPNHFYQDLHNLLVCYVEQNKINKVINTANELVSQGYSLNDFKHIIPQYISKTKEWKDFSQLQYHITRMKYEQKQDSNMEYRNYIASICKKDRDVRIIESNKNIDSVSYIMGKKIETLFKTKKFPNYFFNKDTLAIRIMVVLRHYNHVAEDINRNIELQKKHPYKLMKFNDSLNFILKKALINGYIRPRNYVAMTTYDMRKNKYGSLAVTYNFDTEDISLRIFPNENYDEINLERISIGLPIINPKDTNVLKESWFQYVDIKKLKQSMLECDSCKTYSDYLAIQAKERLKVRNKYENENNKFILFNYNVNQHLLVGNVKKYMINILKQ